MTTVYNLELGTSLRFKNKDGFVLLIAFSLWTDGVLLWVAEPAVGHKRTGIMV